MAVHSLDIDWGLFLLFVALSYTSNTEQILFRKNHMRSYSKRNSLPERNAWLGNNRKNRICHRLKARYKSDSAKAFRAIVYTKGGKHVVLNSSPLYILFRAKKYNKELDVRISGATSLLPVALVMAAIIALCPFYVVLLRNSPGASGAHFIVLAAIWVVLGIIRPYVLDTYAIRYRFWRRILQKKWLSYIILGCYYSSFFAALLVLSYFPNWVVVSLLGVYLGIVQPPLPSRYGSNRYNHILSYEQLFEIYINKADFWEDHLSKNRETRLEKKRKK